MYLNVRKKNRFIIVPVEKYDPVSYGCLFWETLFFQIVLYKYNTEE